MKRVEYFYWMLPPDAWRKRGGRSSCMMDAETAQQRHPGATPILTTREIREVLEPGDPHPASLHAFIAPTWKEMGEP